MLSFGESLMQFITGSGNQTQSASQFGDAPSGYGDMYDALFAMNPYRKQSYRQSGWQKLLSSMGFRTGYDDWLDQTSTQIGEYDAGIMSMMKQNEYDDPSAQASRMRNAGMNPDLLGTGDVALANSPTEDPNGMVPGGAEDVKQVATALSGFASSCLQAFSLAGDLMKKSADIQSIRKTMNGIELDNNKKAVDLIDQIIVGSVPISAWTDDSGLDKYYQPIDLSVYGFSGDRLVQAEQMYRDRFSSLKNNSELLKHVYNRFGYTEGINKKVMNGLLPEEQFKPYIGGDPTFDIFLNSYANIARQILDLKQVNELVENRDLVPQEQLNQEIAGDIRTAELSTMNGEGYGESLGASTTYFQRVQQIIAKEKASMYNELSIKAQAGDDTARMVLHAMALQDMMQFEVSGGLDLSLLKGLSSLFTKNGTNKTKGFKSGFGFDFNITARTK